MKVICIHAFDRLVDGKEYEVEPSEEFVQRTHLHPTYLVKEINAHYYQKRFVPISAIDEKEFERNYNLQTV